MFCVPVGMISISRIHIWLCDTISISHFFPPFVVLWQGPCNQLSFRFLNFSLCGLREQRNSFDCSFSFFFYFYLLFSLIRNVEFFFLFLPHNQNKPELSITHRGGGVLMAK